MGAADVANIRDLVGDTAWTLYADTGLFDSRASSTGRLRQRNAFTNACQVRFGQQLDPIRHRHPPAASLD